MNLLSLHSISPSINIMRHFLLVLIYFVLFPIAIHGELILESRYNSLRNGDAISYSIVDFTDTVSEGDNKIWDLSTSSLSKRYSLHIESLSDKNDTLTCVINRTKYHFIQRGDSITGRGFENNLSDMFYNSDGEILICFPLRYGQSYTGTVVGSGRHVDRWTQSAVIRYTVRADSRGYLITPDNDTICDVLRIYTYRELRNILAPVNVSDKRCKNDSVTVYQVMSRIYAPGYRYPLVVSEMVKSESNEILSAKTYYFSSSSMAGLDDADNSQARDSVSRNYSERILALLQARDKAESDRYSHIDYQFSQDKVGGKITFTYTVMEPADVEFILADVSGIVYGAEYKHSLPGEIYTVTFDYSKLPFSATYGVSISIGNERYSEKFYR